MSGFRWGTCLSAIAVLFILGFPALAAPPAGVQPPTAQEFAALVARVNALEGLVATLQTQLATEISARQTADANLQSSINNASVPGLRQYVTVTEVDGLPRIVFHDVNIQLVNGTGSTAYINGKGNLVIGYDGGRYPVDWEWECSFGYFESQEACELSGFVWALNHKSGSHNLVVGDAHNYPSYGGFVAGWWNTINGGMSSVSGGQMNHASGGFSSVSGGVGNHAKDSMTSISGGRDNKASGIATSVSGGYWNTASGEYHSSVCGGYNNIASADYSTVSGGRNNRADGLYSVVIGGNGNISSGEDEIAP